MDAESERARRLRLQRLAAISGIVVLVAGAIVRASGRAIGTTLLEIGAALVIVAVILALFARRLGKSSTTLDEVRRTEPNSFLCYYENNKRGIISAHDGALVLRRFKGKKIGLVERVPLGQFTIEPGKMQLTAARQVDGIIVASTDPAELGAVRIALSHDKMTLLGSFLTGAELERATAVLRSGG
jgi:hypothetical protein